MSLGHGAFPAALPQHPHATDSSKSDELPPLFPKVSTAFLILSLNTSRTVPVQKLASLMWPQRKGLQLNKSKSLDWKADPSRKLSAKFQH